MAKQVYDLDSDKMITVEDAGDDKGKGADAQTEESSEEESEEEEEEESDEDNGSEEEEEEESDDDKSKDKDKEDEESEEEEEEESDEESVDDFIKNKFGEEYGIESEEDFKGIIDRATELLDKNEELEAEIKKLKETESKPVFMSKTQEVVFNTLKDYDPERIPDGLHMIAGLVGMDLEKTDPKLILEQQFIMEHPELSLDKARKKFQRRFEEKFVLKEEGLEPEEIRDKKEDLETDLQIEVSKAKKFIKEKKEEFKVSTENKEDKDPEISESVQKSIASNTDVFDKHFDGIHTLTFEVDGDDKNHFHFKFSKEQLVRIKAVVDNNLKAPGHYDAKGNLVGGFDPEDQFQTAAFAMYGQQIAEEALKFAKNLAQKIKVDDVANKKPSRKARTSGDVMSMGIDEQADRIAKKKQAERQSRS